MSDVRILEGGQTADKRNYRLSQRRFWHSWEKTKERYAGEQFVTRIRDKEIVTVLKTKSLSGLLIPKVVLAEI